jgi:hypothetical protein
MRLTAEQADIIRQTARQRFGDGTRVSRVRQLSAQVIDCYEPEFKNVYYKRENCCG